MGRYICDVRKVGGWEDFTEKVTIEHSLKEVREIAMWTVDIWGKDSQADRRARKKCRHPPPRGLVTGVF